MHSPRAQKEVQSRQAKREKIEITDNGVPNSQSDCLTEQSSLPAKTVHHSKITRVPSLKASCTKNFDHQSERTREKDSVM